MRTLYIRWRCYTKGNNEQAMLTTATATQYNDLLFGGLNCLSSFSVQTLADGIKISENVTIKITFLYKSYSKLEMQIR